MPKRARGGSAGQRGRILDFARDLFFRYGFSRVTVEEIAVELHISKTTFYRHFRSKEDLLSEAIRAYYGAIRRGISEITAHGAGGYGEELKKAMLYIGEMLQRIDSRARQDIRTSVPRIWQTLEEFQHRMIHEVLEKMLLKGREDEMVRPDVDAKLMAHVLVMTFENNVSSEALRSLSISTRDAFQTLVDFFLDGILIGRRKGPSRNMRTAPAARGS